MKKRLLLFCPLILVLAFTLAACGQASNSGLTSDKTSSTKATPVVLHSGGGNCFERYGDLASHADLGRTSEPPEWQSGSSPFFGAEFASCPDYIGLSWSTSFDFYQIRWSRPGINEQQFSTSNQGSINFTNAQFRTIYSFKLQGCNSGFFGSSCSDWSPTVTVVTYYPGDCQVGYVWRQANSSDYVCVTSATRDQTAYDNSQRYNRVNPYGVYGPDTCIQGYVWREAYTNDDVCVIPATRSQAAYDNSQADARSYH